MNIKTAIATATVSAVLATAGVSLAGAAGRSAGHAGSSPTAALVSTGSASQHSTPHFGRARRARRLRLRALLRGAAGVVTSTIGIDRPTLRNDLRAGQTIAEIATAHGVDPQTVVNALVTAATTKLDQWATEGLISTTRARAIETRLPARLTRLVDNWHPHRRVRATAAPLA